MDKLHKYTRSSVLKTIYLCILLTAIAINNGYASKTGMQQLSEGKLNQKSVKKYKKKNKTKNNKTKNTEKVPNTNNNNNKQKQTKETQTKLENYLKK